MVFCKEDESLEDEGHGGQPSEAGNNQMRASSKLVLLQLHKKLPKNSPSTILWSFGIWSKLDRWKSSISGCLRSWPKIKKIVILKCHLLSYATTVNHFSIWLWCVMKSGLTFVWQQRRSSKALPKAKLVPNKWSWSLFGGLLPVWSTNFLNPGKTTISEKHAQQINEMHGKPQRWQWSTERAQFPFEMMPGCMPHTQRFKSWTNWATTFCLICHLHLTPRQPTTSSSSISTIFFCRENASTTSRRQKVLSKSLSNPEGQIFTLQQ